MGSAQGAVSSPDQVLCALAMEACQPRLQAQTCARVLGSCASLLPAAASFLEQAAALQTVQAGRLQLELWAAALPGSRSGWGPVGWVQHRFPHCISISLTFPRVC